MDTVQQIADVCRELNAGQLDLLLEMARAMKTKIEQVVSLDSDIVVPEFAANFSNRLLIHHATNEEKFKKKSFEYAFRAASRSAKRKAEITDDPCCPGADVVVDGVQFSLKTEAAASISPDKITISKLMEARWIRECQSGADFARGIKRKVVTHLRKYERILTLRAFSVETSAVRYDLVEIPCALLLEMGKLTARDFAPPNENHSGKADVYRGNVKAFSVRLDGSVEKITISGLLTNLCRKHASWTVPTIGPSPQE